MKCGGCVCSCLFSVVSRLVLWVNWCLIILVFLLVLWYIRVMLVFFMEWFVGGGGCMCVLCG